MSESTLKNQLGKNPVRLKNTLGLGLFAMLFVAWPLNDFVRQDKNGQARRKAEILSYQLAQLYQENLQSSEEAGKSVSLRGPASVSSEQLVEFHPEGLLGSDPWGQAFEYKILNVEPSSIRLQIRSAGPNRKFEESAQNSSGDDLTMVYQVPVSNK